MKKKITNILVNIFGFIPDLILSILERIITYLNYIIFNSRKKKNIKSVICFQNIEFKLNLKKDDHQAHDVYRNLNKKKNVIYELPLITIIIEILKKENFKNFLDLGAFMGYYSCLLGKLFHNKDITFHAIESNEVYCSYINKNIEENKLKNVNLINAVLSDKSELLYIENESVKSKDINNKLVKTQSNTLDSICSQFSIKPEILKIDVHGFEGKVLNGFKNNLVENSKIVLLELHSNSYLKEYSDSNKKEIINFLLDLNFNCYIVPYYGELNLYKVDSNFLIENHKVSFRKINKSNYEDLFFDKEHTDNLIVAFKQEIDINKYNCFLDLSERS